MSAALAFAGLVPCSGAAETAPLSAYERAVQEYVSAAAQETARARAQLAKLQQPAGAAVPGSSDLVAEVGRGLERCEALVAQLEKAGPSRFDLIKKQYESARGELLAALSRAASTLARQTEQAGAPAAQAPSQATPPVPGDRTTDTTR